MRNILEGKKIHLNRWLNITASTLMMFYYDTWTPIDSNGCQLNGMEGKQSRDGIFAAVAYFRSISANTRIAHKHKPRRETKARDNL